MKEANFLQQSCCEKNHTLLPLSNVSNSEFLHKKFGSGPKSVALPFLLFLWLKTLLQGSITKIPRKKILYVIIVFFYFFFFPSCVRPGFLRPQIVCVIGENRDLLIQQDTCWAPGR